jgi:hypothetical protein
MTCDLRSARRVSIAAAGAAVGCALVVMAVACGDEVAASGSPDGPAEEMALPSPDASTDRPLESGPEDAPPGDATLDINEGSLDGISADSEACAITMGTTLFDACTYDSCGPSDFCGFSEGPAQKNYGICLTVPACCLPNPTCACILATLPCNSPKCSDDEGRIILTCERPLPP